MRSNRLSRLVQLVATFLSRLGPCAILNGGQLGFDMFSCSICPPCSYRYLVLSSRIRQLLMAECLSMRRTPGRLKTRLDVRILSRSRSMSRNTYRNILTCRPRDT